MLSAIVPPFDVSASHVVISNRYTEPASLTTPATSQYQIPAAMASLTTTLAPSQYQTPAPSQFKIPAALASTIKEPSTTLAPSTTPAPSSTLEQ